MFIGRERELSEWERRYQQNCFQMFVLYGRRRVGKTTFLKEFCKGKSYIFYSVEQSNHKMNLEKFSSLIFQHYKENSLAPFESWENAFLYIGERQADRQLVVVLDEFPYLAASDPEILSTLQHLIDHKLKESRIFLVLCGSYMGFMEKEVLGAKSPLFGRRTGQLRMKEFDYKVSSQFLSAFPNEEKLLLYGAIGGTPMYLSQISNNRSVRENITDLFLTPTGYLYEEPQLLLRQEVQEPGVYNAIIEAIASGASHANEIATKAGEPTAKCLKYIHILCELGIVYKEIPFGEKSTSRKTIYQISDLMFRFWYRYITGNKTLLETGGQDIVWKLRIEPDLSQYMGYVFEVICKDYLLRKNSTGKLPFFFSKIGRWWGTDPKKRKQVEIDLIAGDDHSYLFCECKWRNEKVGMEVFNSLHEKATLFHAEPDQIWYALFSKTGFTESVLAEARNQDRLLLIDLTDLLEK